MDRFDLKWPKTDATFFTDGWRCRIVWRQKGGMGGTIENNVQCVERVARSLDGAPYLISALKARGHDRLANQIESLADTPAPLAEPQAAPRKRTAREMGEAWVAQLSGSMDFESATSRRAKTWIELGVCRCEAGEETLFLKTPTKRGKQEWALKRTWTDSKRKAEYIAAGAFKGIAVYLVGAGADGRFIESLLSASVEESDHEELKLAASAWRSVQDTATH